MAHYHLTRFSRFPAVQTVACYDRCRPRAAGLADEFNLQPFDDIDELLQVVRPDALSVAVADAQHHEIAMAAIKRGVPVFLEKPITADVVQGEHLVELQERYGVPVMVNYSKLNYPAVYGLLQAVDAERLGRLLQVELHYRQSWLVSNTWGDWWKTPRWLWRISSSHGGGGALRDLGAHLMYLALRFGGPGDSVEAVEVEQSVRAARDAARDSGHSCDMNDTFSGEIRFAGGLVVTLYGTYADKDCENQVYVRAVGTTGSAEITAGRDKSTLHLRRGPSGDTRQFRFAKVYSTYASFVDCLQRNTPWENFQPSVREGLAVQRMLSGMMP
jgi:predicted dehydrogenase